jgi:formyl-CoA transferase
VASGDEVTQPLAGIRVVDLTQVYSGPYCAFLMAQGGAEVIKIEPPAGESLRQRNARRGAGAPFAMMNAGKRSMTLDLKSAEGKAILTRLIETADVLLENYRPGVLARLGFDHAAIRAINPRVVVGSISGFGSKGPYRDYPAMDLTVQAMSGVMASTGLPDGAPLKAGAAVADLAAGTHLYAAVLTALFHRERTGEAKAVEVAMVDALYPTLASNVGLALAGGPGHVSRTGNRHGGLSLCPYSVYPAADGHVAIICTNENHWVSLVAALKLDHLAGPEFDTMEKRVARMDHVDAEVGKASMRFGKEALFQTLNAARVPCGSVREMAEVLHDPHLHETGMLFEMDHPQYGRLVLSHTPMRFLDEHRPAYRPSVALGADTDAVLGEELGMSADEIADLRAKGVI